MPQNLYDKLWQSHVVHEESDGTALIYIDRHLVHEVTSPQAFEGLRLALAHFFHRGHCRPQYANQPLGTWYRGSGFALAGGDA